MIFVAFLPQKINLILCSRTIVGLNCLVRYWGIILAIYIDNPGAASCQVAHMHIALCDKQLSLTPSDLAEALATDSG